MPPAIDMCAPMRSIRLSFSIVTRRTRIVALCAAAIIIATVVAQFAQGNGTADVQLLAINDFHGALEPPSGDGGRIGSASAGGAAYLATHLARLKATNPNTIVVSAGDNIGGTPLLSSLFHDEASIEALNLAGLQVSALGNHELDEGWWELYRIQKGGCHPVDGCQDGTPFSGASFRYLAANVTLNPRQADPQFVALAGIQGTQPRPLLPAYDIREVDGVRIGFIGLILQAAPTVIVPASVRGLTFAPEADAANEAARALREQGVRAIVVLMHQGGDQRGDVNACDRMSPDLLELVDRFSDDIDVVVSGHSHQAYNCTIGRKLVTSASSSGRVVTDIDLQVRRSDEEVVAKQARNIVVTRDVPKESAQAALIARYLPVADKIGNRVVGTIVSSLGRQPSDAGEFPLGSVVADAFLEAGKAPGGGAELAFTNPGSIRADVVALEGSHKGSPVTYSVLFSVLPFGNEVIVKSLTGDELMAVLEQQFGADRTRIMQVSRGVTYAYDPGRPAGQRIDRASVRINGAPLDPARRYRVATNSFLWGAGDGLRALSRGVDPVTVGVDVDVLADYVSRHSPLPAPTPNRIRRIR
jgi:5'-nucleotidase